MAIKLGSTDINQLYLGSTDIKKAYLGSTLIHDTTVAPAGITLEQTVAWTLEPYPGGTIGAATTQTITLGDAANTIIAIVLWDRQANNNLDTSMDTGGGNLPTCGGNDMTVGDLFNQNKRHAGIYGYKPGTTAQQTVSINPNANSRAMLLLEYSGVNDTIFNASGGASGAGQTSRSPVLTTVDSDGVIVGGVWWSFKDVIATVSAPATELGATGQTGTNNLDGVYQAGTVDVAAAAASEGITFNSNAASDVAACIVELNPA